MVAVILIEDVKYNMATMERLMINAFVFILKLDLPALKETPQGSAQQARPCTVTP